jgi:hypothetical protein
VRARFGTTATIGTNQCVNDACGVGSCNILGVFEQKVVPHNHPRPVKLGLSDRSREEPDVQVRSAVADSIYVGSCNIRLGLYMTPNMGDQDT